MTGCFAILYRLSDELLKGSDLKRLIILLPEEAYSITFCNPKQWFAWILNQITVFTWVELIIYLMH